MGPPDTPLQFLIPELGKKLLDREHHDSIIGRARMGLERDDNAPDFRPIFAERTQTLEVVG